MNPALLQRLAALAGVALLAALGALALAQGEDGGVTPTGGTTVGPRVAWEQAQVSVFGADRTGEETSCGIALTSETVGIAHPVLPCGVVLVLERGGREIRAPVIEQGDVGAGHTFELSPALARALAVEGAQDVRWRFPG